MPITPPLGTCCKGDKGKCAPQAKWWTHPVWAALRFSVDDPHYFSYSYTVKGKSFTVRAHADLDCDGEYSTFEMYGEVSDRFPDGPSRNAGVLRTKELE